MKPKSRYHILCAHFFSSLLLCLSATSLFAQHSLTVKKNQVKTIDANNKSLLLDTLILEDNATLLINENVPAISIIAKHVIIGFNTVIDGSKKNIPAAGTNGNNGQDAPAYCTNAGDGNNGQNGIDGNDGADIFLYLRIRSIGSMTIKTNGSNASNGGNGGDGGRGANSNPNLTSSCIAKPGGRGGNGGNGGYGGHGGTVFLNYTFLDPSGNFLAVQPPLTQVEVNSNGGNGGAAGKGGQKGQPGKKTLGVIDQTLNNSVPAAGNGIEGKSGKTGVFTKALLKQNL